MTPIDAFDRPAASAAGDSAKEGTSGAAARADHQHAREATDANLSSTAGNIAQIDVADTASAGALTTGARADHQHALPAPAAPAALGSTAATGSASTVARADHVHAAPSQWSLTGSNQGLELGTSGSSNTPYVDFHSGATGTDYDARIIASGGTGTAGKGTLGIQADYVQLGLNGNNSGTDLLACDGTNEGGQLNLKGAGAYGDVNIDNFQGNLRLLTAGGAPYVAGASAEHFSKRDNRLVEAGEGGSMIKSGQANISVTAGGGTGSAQTVVTFAGDTFGATPRVVASIAGGAVGKLIIRCISTSTTQTTLNVYTGDGGTYPSTTTLNVDWIAVGST